MSEENFNQEPEYFVCVDLNDEWYVQVENNYGDHDFLLIKEYINVEEVESVSDIFTMMESVLNQSTGKTDQYNNTIIWHLSDYDNIYQVNNLPEKYYKKDYDPGCFESFSESEVDSHRRSIDQNYFDTLINNF